SEINNFAYYKASGGCARILQGNMPLSAAKIRRSKRQNEKSFVVYYNIILLTSIITFISCFFCAGKVTDCFAEEKKADISAISGFGKNYSVDQDGKFEIEGVMVVGDTIYNITAGDDMIQSWTGKYKGRYWSGDALKELLDKPETLFYGKVSGTKDKAEFSNEVKFTRPNGQNY
ncbi:MAG: hypothetical protein II966_07605, partial [Lachnospiraceae bacterium]|nr:hypothetical protein [Lachnospiraceae bacterium]